MKDSADSQILELFPVKRGRGRPRTGTALTPAQKQKAYRDRKRAGQVASLPSVEVEREHIRQQVVDLQIERDSWRRSYRSACSEIERLAKELEFLKWAAPGANPKNVTLLDLKGQMEKILVMLDHPVPELNKLVRCKLTELFKDILVIVNS